MRFIFAPALYGALAVVLNQILANGLFVADRAVMIVVLPLVAPFGTAIATLCYALRTRDSTCQLPRAGFVLQCAMIPVWMLIIQTMPIVVYVLLARLDLLDVVAVLRHLFPTPGWIMRLASECSVAVFAGIVFRYFAKSPSENRRTDKSSER